MCPSTWMLAPLLATALAPLLPAQNLLANGDFEASKTLITPWWTEGFALNPRMESFDVTGAGKTNCYAATITDKLHVLKQRVRLQGGRGYNLKVEFHCTTIVAGTCLKYLVCEVGYRPLWTPEVRVTDFQLDLNKKDLPVATHGGVRFVPGTDTDYVYLRFRWAGSCGIPGQGRVRLDNIQLVPESRPTLWVESARNLAAYGSSASTMPLHLRTNGVPGAGQALLLSAGRLATPVKIPGFEGSLELDPRLGLFLMATTVHDLAGLGKADGILPVPMVRSLVGVPFHYQAVTVDPTRRIFGLGPATIASFLP